MLTLQLSFLLNEGVGSFVVAGFGMVGFGMAGNLMAGNLMAGNLMTVMMKLQESRNWMVMALDQMERQQAGDSLGKGIHFQEYGAFFPGLL